MSICARVESASAQDLVAVLKSCKELFTLDLDEFTDYLVDEATLEAIAKHQSIETLHINRLINDPLASSAVGVAQPFPHLVSLLIEATPEAAGVILPRLDRLENLYLSVSGTGSVFPALGKIKTLQAFTFESASYPLTDHDLSYMKSLENLESLQFQNDQQRSLFHENRVSPEILASVLGSLPKLHTLEIHAHNTLGSSFLIALGRACRSLKSLRLSGNFTLDNIADETGTLFPCLEWLQLGKVKPSNPPGRQHQGFVEQDWADQVARHLDRHAPKLHWIYFCLDEKDDIAQMAANAWWFLWDKREFRAMLERDGTPKEDIDRYVSNFTPVSDWVEAQVSQDNF